MVGIHEDIFFYDCCWPGCVGPPWCWAADRFLLYPPLWVSRELVQLLICKRNNNGDKGTNLSGRHLNLKEKAPLSLVMPSGHRAAKVSGTSLLDSESLSHQNCSAFGLLTRLTSDWDFKNFFLIQMTKLILFNIYHRNIVSPVHLQKLSVSFCW